MKIGPLQPSTATVSPTDTAAFIDRAAGFMAFAIPMLLSVLTSTKEPYWLDAPEFTAAAQILGIPHPPGHPLYVMLTKPFTLLPIGTIAFRVSLASAFFGALASFFLFLICHFLVRKTARGLPGWMRALVALTAALFASVTPGWWQQCIRQEVYALQTAVILAAVYPLLRFTLAPKRANEHLLYVAAFLTGIGITNHHFIMLAAVPAIIPQLVATARYRTGLGAVKLTLGLIGTAAIGLSPYLFLPIRAASGVPVSLGGVHSISDFFWVISAKAYQKSMAKEHLQSLTNAGGSVSAFFDRANPLLLITALLGFYLLLRARRTRMAGIFLVLLTAVIWLLRVTMGFDPFGPDYNGYFMPVIAALAMGAAVFAAVTLHVIRTQTSRGPALSLALIVACALLPLYQAKSVFGAIDLSSFRETRLFKSFCFDRVVPGSLVLANTHSLFFTLWSARFIDGTRPDLIVINPALFGYPGYLNATLKAHPELTPLARALLVHRHLTEASVAELALDHSVRIEPSIALHDAVVRYMLPDGPLYQTLPEPLAPSDVAAASPDHHRFWKTLYALLGNRWREPETFRMLAWSHYQDALFMARRGDRDGAADALDMGLALNPDIKELLSLKAALQQTKRGLLDVAGFLAGAPPTDEPPPDLGK